MIGGPGVAAKAVAVARVRRGGGLEAETVFADLERHPGRFVDWPAQRGPQGGLLRVGLHRWAHWIGRLHERERVRRRTIAPDAAEAEDRSMTSSSKSVLGRVQVTQHPRSCPKPGERTRDFAASKVEAYFTAIGFMQTFETRWTRVLLGFRAGATGTRAPDG